MHKTFGVGVMAYLLTLAPEVEAAPAGASPTSPAAATAAPGGVSKRSVSKRSVPPAAPTLVGEPSCPNDERALAALVSLFPGVVLHGAGHYVHGCRETGEKLLWASLGGLGLMMTAFAPAFLFGAHPYLVPLQAVVGTSGLVLFSGSWLFDVYGSLVPRSLRGAAQAVPVLETNFGYRYVYDPVFEYRHFLVQGFELWQGSLRLGPRADFSLGAYNARYALPVAFRVAGATPSRPRRDGSFLEIETRLTHHDFSPEGFRVDTIEFGLDSRIDSGRFDRELSGTFTEFGAGVGWNRYAYDAEAAEPDVNSLLLMSFALGAYFGGPVTGGEAKLYYDHRHDDFAAGLKLEGLGSGVIGHFGIESRAYLDEHWGLLLDLQLGSAYVTNLSLLFRQLPEPGASRPGQGGVRAR